MFYCLKMIFTELVVIILIFTNATQAVWYNDIISPSGWQFGDEMTFHIEDTKNNNSSSFFDRIALRVDYGNVEVSAVQKPEEEAVQLNFFTKDQQEGRASKKNMGNMLIPFFFGVAKGTAVTTLLAGMKMIALKSLLLAKVAVLISAAIVLSKYFKKQEPYYFEVDQSAGSEHLPVYEYPGGATAVAGNSQATYAVPYHAYAPSAADSVGAYATVVNVGGENETVANKQHIASGATKRKDYVKRKNIHPTTLLTIKHYTNLDSLL